MKTACDELFITTDDGSKGRKGFVTDQLKDIINNEKKYRQNINKDYAKLKEKFSRSEEDILREVEEEGYVELGTEAEEKAKIIVRPFFIETFEDIKPILDSLREGSTICLVNIRPLKEKDLIELKRAISKVKKTVEAMEGSITGFGENIVIATPQFAQISAPKVDIQEPKNRFDSY